jgi:hypothetical protein
VVLLLLLLSLLCGLLPFMRLMKLLLWSGLLMASTWRLLLLRKKGVGWGGQIA